MDIEKAEEVIKACDELIEELKEMPTIEEKREEIREGLKELILPIYYPALMKEILTFLDSAGCVLKVERELPALICEEPEGDKYKLGVWYGASKQINLFENAGYATVAPLIEEEK